MEPNALCIDYESIVYIRYKRPINIMYVTWLCIDYESIVYIRYMPLINIIYITCLCIDYESIVFIRYILYIPNIRNIHNLAGLVSTLWIIKAFCIAWTPASPPKRPFEHFLQ